MTPEIPPLGLTLILGGARSGKSAYAQRLAEASGKPVTFIATAQALDDEMAARIAKHRAERPAHWQTLELPAHIAAHLSEIIGEVVILDCVTLLLSNLLFSHLREDGKVDEAGFERAVEEEIEPLLQALQSASQRWIIVSNEVGLGLVPTTPIGRVYRDTLGRVNQRLAQRAQQVIWMVAGIPVPIGQYRIETRE